MIEIMLDISQLPMIIDRWWIFEEFIDFRYWSMMQIFVIT